MRINGYNLFAILGAALAFWLVGFVVYGLMIDPQFWIAEMGITPAEMAEVGESRMPFSPVMPIVSAIGLALLVRWAGAKGLGQGAKLGAIVALASAVPAIWYGWVYGTGSAALPLIDSAHLLAAHIVAGAIIARWN